MIIILILRALNVSRWGKITVRIKQCIRKQSLWGIETQRKIKEKKKKEDAKVDAAAMVDVTATSWSREKDQVVKRTTGKRSINV